MISNRSGTHQSEFMQALVPMVDLFAVLAIVFMIYSNEEIIEARSESRAEVREVRLAMAAADEEEEARRARRDSLADAASKSLEEIRAERERQSEQILAQVAAMLAAQQSSAADEYESILARIESEHEQDFQRERTALAQRAQTELDAAKAELELDFEARRVELVAQQERRVDQARQQFDRALTAQQAVLATTRDSLAQSERARAAALARQDELDAQRRREVAQTEQVLMAQAASNADSLRRETQAALARAQQERADALARAERERADALAQAEQERLDALARQAAALEAERQREVERTEQEARAQADREAAALRAEADRALARADSLRESELAAQRAALEEERARALAEAADELAPYVQAAEAKNQIIDELRGNFRGFPSSSVEIDPETGKVKLHFEKSYFALGSAELSEDMKEFLREMIPRYAASIYGNTNAAAHVESLNISGMASPVYQGVYIDIMDRSPGTEAARQYNMTLSNRRAEALYAFIFDEDEMGDYPFRERMEADMSIAAFGFQNSAPVPAHLVGKPARCIEYDCRQEQATILQFQLFTGGS